MKVLHLTSDWKWTGPAEPMLLLHTALRDRGHEVELACAEPPPQVGERGLAGEARLRGARPLLSLERARGIRWWRDRDDARRLSLLVRERGIEVLHAWHSRDHMLAIRAARGSSAAVVRTLAGSQLISGAPWNRWLFGPGADGLLCCSSEVERACARLRFGRPTVACLGAVDPARFRPSSGGGQDSRARQRAKLGLALDAPVIGVVARVQRHRRFDLLLEAMRELLQTHPRARLLIVGRGTHIDEVARRPAAALGIAEQVVFAGYRRDDYSDVLRALDLLTFLVPGSDGTCRAVLEASACGLPTVATRRGALPEIVLDGETGLLIEENPRALASAWRRLIDDPAARAALGARAAARAGDVFQPDRLAADVEALYRRALAAR